MILKVSKLSIALLLLFTCTITFISCEKDETEDMATDDQDDDDDDPANSTGRFSDFISCDIISTPAAVNLNSLYTKYINCSGIPVVGSTNVSDEALLNASETIEFMLTGLGAIRSRLIMNGNYAVIYEDGMELNDVPEVIANNVACCFEGVYIGGEGVLVSPEYSIVCDPFDGSIVTSVAGNIFIHEMGHMLDLGAIRQLNSDFSSNILASYNSAIGRGLWNGAYAATNDKEYFAEGVMIWYGQNWIDDNIRNEIGTRSQLEVYDTQLHNLIAGNINNLTDVPGCRESVISGATANCPETVTDIDGNSYEVVNIGPMCWMKENLRTTRYKDGSAILNLPDNADWENATQGAWSNYDNDPSLDMFGKIYNTRAFQNSAGLCPQGWHVPSIQELTDLTQYAGGDYASKNIKATTMWPTSGNTNQSGFTALPSGVRNVAGFFSGFGSQALYFSTTVNTEQQLYSRAIFDDTDFMFTLPQDQNFGVPCRCIKDE